MTRRATLLGLLLVTQLAVGCCWARCGPGWRLRRQCCSPSFSAPVEAPAVSPIAGPLVAASPGPLAGPVGGPGCTSCSTPLAPPDTLVGAAPVPVFHGPGPAPFAPGIPPGAPVLGVPQPLGGPTIEPGINPSGPAKSGP